MDGKKEYLPQCALGLQEHTVDGIYFDHQRRTSPGPMDGEKEYLPQCALGLQVHTVDGIYFYQQ
jgi:hypothetical protein